MIKYRPQRGSLSSSLKDEKLFTTMDDMKQYIYEEWRRVCEYMDAKDPFMPDEIVVGRVIGDDDRIDWKNVRHVCVKRMCNEVYDTPQCIGYCGE